VRFNRGVTGGELRLTHIEEFQILLQHEDVLGAIVSGQRGGDFRLGRVAAMVAVIGELGRVAPAGDDIAQDAEAGHPGNVADHERQLEVHLDQRFLHALDVRPGALDERLPVPQIRAQRHDRVGRSKAPSQQAHTMQLPQPLTI